MPGTEFWPQACSCFANPGIYSLSTLKRVEAETTTRPIPSSWTTIKVVVGTEPGTTFRSCLPQDTSTPWQSLALAGSRKPNISHKILLARDRPSTFPSHRSHSLVSNTTSFYLAVVDPLLHTPVAPTAFTIPRPTRGPRARPA
jgi:hypothetical protein